MIKFYGLLHLAEGEKSLMNSYAPEFEQQIRLYASNATLLALTLRNKGIEFTLITNKKDYLLDIFKEIKGGNTVAIKEIDFEIQIPSGIRFYSDHFKIDLYRYFSRFDQDNYICYCDLDMLVINKVPTTLEYIVRERIPMCYDITEQIIPAIGHEVMIADMQKLNASAGEGRWSGGEFIAGPPEFFSLLGQEINSVFDNYLANLDNLHHVGSEMFVSVALEQLRRKGMYIADAGSIGIVGRYWSSRTLHPQKPFKYFKNCFLLHLPADKNFLSEFCSRGVINDSLFLEQYSSQVCSPIAKGKRLASSALRKARAKIDTMFS